MMKNKGFTIVELLVVIVAVGILASIVVVSYNGAHKKGRETALRSDLTNAATQMELDRIAQKDYPASESLADGGNGLPKGKDTSYQLTVNNTAKTFCLTATSINAPSSQYYITQNGSPKSGVCPGHTSSGGSASPSGEVKLAGVTIEIFGWDQSAQHDANVYFDSLATQTTTGASITGGYKIEVQYDTPCNTPTDGAYSPTFFSETSYIHDASGYLSVDGPGGSCEFARARFYEVSITGITAQGETVKKKLVRSDIAFPFNEHLLYWGS